MFVLRRIRWQLRRIMQSFRQLPFLVTGRHWRCFHNLETSCHYFWEPAYKLICGVSPGIAPPETVMPYLRDCIS